MFAGVHQVVRYFLLARFVKHRHLRYLFIENVSMCYIIFTIYLYCCVPIPEIVISKPEIPVNATSVLARMNVVGLIVMCCNCFK